ncbi:glycosyltransferase [Solidesulfovibrio sp.]|jgi:glycosyltransferase involved in cell wall biosynthesis|uniref:glycosyltransferase n=1 Tax=Solidesulfovibrio sp. TaxID=2910990 RepID=UPI000ED4CA72|nr:glycosyltransferase [Solidesulfovibrio sp.]MEA5088934.1 glycosyltransferase [Solidesulfovibrio sp.]HCR13150.1 hypothetical protein [Desulfovibrio sp.]HML59711.1 glycosyltransferase [Solidesulfovibrio sp.]
MRIVSVTADIDSGGSAKSLFVLARALAAEGHALHIMSIARPSRTRRKVEALREMGVEVSFFDIPYFPLKLIVCPIPFWRNMRRALLRHREFARLVQAVRAFAPDVVHYNSYTTLHAAALLGRYPAVLHAREVLVEPHWMLPLVRRLMRASIDAVIAISPEEGEQAARLFGLPVTTIFNAPLRPPRLEPMPEAPPLAYGAFSHITPIKGQLELVRACALAAGALRKAGVRLKIFGGAVGIHQAYHDAVAGEIASLGIADVATLAGFTDQPEAEMRRVHLIVRPDATGQPWGRDVIESMSMGRPVLATGSSRTFIRPGENGMLVPPRDIPALADALARLADLRTLQEMGQAAYAFARDHFDPGTNIRNTIAALARTAGK